MTQEELKELQEMEGPVKSLTPKPLNEMSDAELEAFVTGLRDCTTQYQSLIAENRVREEKREKKDVNEGLFE
jgi:hypothetical protein